MKHSNWQTSFRIATRARLAALALLPAAFGCQQSVPKVVELVDALAAHQIDRAVATLEPTATLDVDGKLYTGIEEIKAALAQVTVAPMTPAVRAGLTLKDGRVAWTQPYTTPEVEALQLAPVEAVMTATLVGDKLAKLAWQMTPAAISALQAARQAQVTAVLSRFESAINARNTDAALAMLAEDATVQWLDRQFKGQPELHEWVNSLVSQSTAIERASEPVADASGASSSWRARLIRSAQPDGVQVAPVEALGMIATRNGKIAQYVITPSPAPVAQDAQADAGAQAAQQ